MLQFLLCQCLARNYLFCIACCGSYAVHFTCWPKFPTSCFLVLHIPSVILHGSSRRGSFGHTLLCFHHLFVACTFQETPVMRPYYIVNVVTVFPFPTGVFDVTFVTSNHLYACRHPESNNQPVMPRYLCEVLSTSARKAVMRTASFLFIVLRINIKNYWCGPVQWLLSLVMEQSIFNIPVKYLQHSCSITWQCAFLAVCCVPLFPR